MEHNGLAGEILMIILGEGNVDVLLLAGLHADDLILKAGNEAAGAELKLVILALAALECFAVVEAFKVDHGNVAELGLALNGNEARVALDHLLQALLDILSGDLDLFLLRADALVLAELDLGIHGDGGLKGEPVSRNFADDLHVGIADDIQTAGADCLRICLGQGGIHSIAVEYACAVQFFNHLAGRLARTEARNANLLARLQVSLGDGSFKFFCADFNGEGDSAFFKLFGVFHSHDFFFLRIKHIHAFAVWYCNIDFWKYLPLFC